MKTILVVEDNHLAQMAMKFIFKSFDCEVDFASTGKETLAYLDKKHYDLVFFDLGLPDIPGLALLKKIRHNKLLHKTRLIILTAHSAEDYEKECLAAGAEAFYTKPLKEDDISALLSD